MRLIFYIACVLYLAGLCDSKTVHVYVSPEGSDSDSGLDVHHPLLTLNKAVSLLNTHGIQGNEVLIELLKGYHDLKTPLHLTHAYSSPVTFRSYNGQEVHVTGGKRILSSTFKQVTDHSVLMTLPVSAHQKVLQVHLPDVGITNYGKIGRFGSWSDDNLWLELSINGQMTRLAQFPNSGFIDITSLPYGQNGTTFVYQSQDDSKWPKEKEPWAYGFWGESWSDEGIKITSIDSKTHTMTLEHVPKHGGLKIGHFNEAVLVNGKLQGGYFRMFNMLSELEEPGEFYLDRSTGMLYVWPNTPSETLGPDDIIYASLIDDCITLGRSASNVHFEDFTLESCRHNGIKLSSSSNIHLQNMELRNTGSYGLKAAGDCRNITVSKCDVHDGTGGIYLQGGDRPLLISSGNVIEDNHIWAYDRVGATGFHGISAFGVGTQVRYNHLHNGQSNGVRWGGNDITIEYNNVHHTCMNASDCGGIHAGRDWTMRGCTLQYNYIHDNVRLAPGAQVRGIMLDDEYSSAVIQYNVFFNNDVHVNIGGGRDNIIRYNIMYDAISNTMQVDGRGLRHLHESDLHKALKAMPYTNTLWRRRFPKLANMTNPLAPEGNQIYRNILFSDPSVPFVRWTNSRFHINRTDYFHFYDNYQKTSSFDFWSPNNSDYRLRCEALKWAHLHQFPQPVSVSKVGPRYPTGPTYKQKAVTHHQPSPTPGKCPGQLGIIG